MRERALCVDIGTSSLKAGVIDSSGELVDFARVPYPPESLASKSLGPGGFHPDSWAKALEKACASLPSLKSVSSVAISGNGPTLVAVGESGDNADHGEALAILPWFDFSAKPIAGEPSLFLPKLARFKEESPSLYEKTARFVSCPEYLGALLGGEFLSYLPHEAYRPYFWTEDSLRAYGIDSALLPPFVETGSPIGAIDKAASKRFGIPRDAKLAAGGPDFIMALLGTAILSPGQALDRAGSSEGINVCMDRVSLDAALGRETSSRQEGNPRTLINSLRPLPSARPGLWNLAAILSASGRLFEWYREVTGRAGTDYAETLAEICALPPSKKCFLLPQAAARDSGYAYLSLKGPTSAAEMGRAVVEAIGFLVRDALVAFEGAGVRIDEMRVSGGQAKNAEWNRLKADIVGVELVIPRVRDAELAGDAAAAFVASGLFSDTAQAANALYREEGRFVPNQARSAQYRELFARWKELGESTRGCFD